MKRARAIFFALAGLALLGYIGSARAQGSLAACKSLVTAEVEKAKADGDDAEHVRFRAEMVAAHCMFPDDPVKAAAVGQINAELGIAAERFMAGKLSGAEYLNLSADRTGKLDRMKGDPSWSKALAAGDVDGDLVPDSYDRCPFTVPLVATFDDGCPLPPIKNCPNAVADCRKQESWINDEQVRRALTGATVMMNPRCDGADTPTTPDPLEWGRGFKAGIAGFNLRTTRVTNQPKGCDVFYEVQARFTGPGSKSLPEVRYVRVLFKHSEDGHPDDPLRTMFGVPAASPPPGPRALLVEGFNHYHHVSWRVRAVNGAQMTSPWSAVREQGPAPAGVN